MILTIKTTGQGAPCFLMDGVPVSAKSGVRLLRSLCNMTQKELARHLSVSRRTVEGWEYGRSVGDAYLFKMSYLLAARNTLNDFSSNE